MSSKITDEVKMQMRDEFVHGVVNGEGVREFPTIDSLQRKYDVPRATLYRYASGGDWQGQKNRYQTELQQKLDEERMTRMVEDSKRLDDSCIQIAQAMLGSVGRKLQKTIELERQNPEYQGLDASTLNQLSSVTANAQKIGKLALGEAQEISKVAADVSNPEAFRSIMDQLDELAATRAQTFDGAIH